MIAVLLYLLAAWVLLFLCSRLLEIPNTKSMVDILQMVSMVAGGAFLFFLGLFSITSMMHYKPVLNEWLNDEMDVFALSSVAYLVGGSFCTCGIAMVCRFLLDMVLDFKWALSQQLNKTSNEA
jgi:hypothetical protein